MNYHKRIKKLYITYIVTPNKEARFLMLISFTLTFIVLRLIVYSIKYHFLPGIFSDIFIRGIHSNQLVFGIIFLLIAGANRIPQFSDGVVRFSSIIYGIGAVLTLDKFAVWLPLHPNIYFGSAGRISIDIVIIFFLILFSSIWYRKFWRKLFDHTLRYVFPFIIKTKRQKILSRDIILVSIAWFAMSICGLLAEFYIVPYIIPLQKRLPVKIQKKTAISPTALCTSAQPLVSLPISLPLHLLAIAQVQAAAQHAKPDFCLTVPVIYYHHIMPDAIAQQRKQTSLSVDNIIFDEQMAYLVHNGYTTITLEQIIHALLSHSQLPPKSIAITLDDGYEDTYTYAFPIFEKYHIIANLAIPSGLMGVHAGGNDYLSWNQIKKMASSGLVFFDDHSWSHASMALNSLEKDQFEIMTAKHQLEETLGKPITAFVYPYGESKPEVFFLLQQDGILGAFSTHPGFEQCESSIMHLNRNHIGNYSLASIGL